MARHSSHDPAFPTPFLLPVLVVSFVVAAWATWNAPSQSRWSMSAEGGGKTLIPSSVGSLLPDTSLVSVHIDDVVEHFPGSMDAVLVVDEKQQYVLPVFVDINEGDAVRRALRGDLLHHSIPHEFLVEAVGSLGGRLDRVELRLEDGLGLVAVVVLSLGEPGKRRQIRLDARPGDALALALSSQAQVFASRQSLEAQGIPRDHPTVGTLIDDIPSPLQLPQSL